MRPSGRNLDQMRPVSIETNVTKHAEGSCMIRMGDTHVLCTATLEDRVPSFIKGSGLGWVTLSLYAHTLLKPEVTHKLQDRIY